jgi:hypothetical protein
MNENSPGQDPIFRVVAVPLGVGLPLLGHYLGGVTHPIGYFLLFVCGVTLGFSLLAAISPRTFFKKMAEPNSWDRTGAILGAISPLIVCAGALFLGQTFGMLSRDLVMLFGIGAAALVAIGAVRVAISSQ